VFVAAYYKGDRQMKKIWNLPIEPLEQRYSEDWIRWFYKEFYGRNLNFETILPQPLTYRIERGSFLDIAGTNYFKAMQIAELSERFYKNEVKDGDIIFLHDVWNPGLSSIAYMRDGLGIDVKIVGCIFAGTYDPYDFLTQKGMGYWGKHLEESWFRILDQIYCATEFHKRLIMQTRDIDPKKLIVTGHPIYPDFVKEGIEKEKIIVFPHRLDKEKNPHYFNTMIADIEQEYKNEWVCIVTKEVCKTKRAYYDMLQKAMISVSFADQETFGFAMIESVFADCLPLVPDRLSYEEMYYMQFKYGTLRECMDRVLEMINNYDWYKNNVLPFQKKRLLDIGTKAIPNMIDCMEKL